MIFQCTTQDGVISSVFCQLPKDPCRTIMPFYRENKKNTGNISFPARYKISNLYIGTKRVR